VLVAAALVGVFGGGIALGSILSERRAPPVVAAAPPVIFIVDAAVATVEVTDAGSDAGDAGDAAAIVDANVAEHVVPKPIVRVIRPPPVDAESTSRPTRLSGDDADAPLP
jgi:hypothetical protein